MDIKLLKDAFSRLLTYTYFDKSDMFLRRAVADFAMNVSDQGNEDDVFGNLLEIAEGRNNAMLQQLLDEIHLIYLPKTLTENKIGFVSPERRYEAPTVARPPQM